MKKKALFGLVFVMIFSLIAMPKMTFASKEVDELKQKQEEVKKSQEEANDKLQETTVKKTVAMDELDKIDKELTLAVDELDSVESDLDNTKQLLGKTEIDLDNAKESKDEQYETFKKRVKYMYENGEMGYMNAILSSDNLTEMFQKAEYVNYIVEYDNNLVDKLQETENLITDKVAEIGEQKEQIEGLVYMQTVKAQNIEEKLNEKNEFVKKLQQDESEYLNQVNALEDSNLAIEKEIKKIEAEEEAKRKAAEAAGRMVDSGFVYSGGKFAWPVPGRSRISSPFGYRGSPISGRSEFHTGIDIPAPTGTNVVAAEAGSIITAGWVNGYGYTVIINHGSGLTTLYGHNSRLVVSKGQSVSRGEVIAKAGSTGYSTGPHSHFEIRANGSATNPTNYLK